MARLIGSGRGVTLAARTTIGRDPQCDFNLADRRVSSLHARIVWNGGAWLIRDLGSTNGTFVDGVRLPPAVDRALMEGMRIAFGDPQDVWTVEQVDSPRARAVEATTGEVVAERGGVLTLEDAAGPALSLIESGGRWTCDDGVSPTLVSDGDTVHVGDRRYRLELPVAAPQTPMSATEDDQGVALSFRIGDDEETLSLTVVTPHGAAVVPHRTSHYVLLALARARILDRAAGFSELQAGWRDANEICRMLATDENRLNVDIHRVRKQLATYGVPLTVIDRRTGERRVRIGVSRLVVAGR